MIVLGLNGWKERGHDGGASLFIDGRLIASIEEEKLIKKRHAYDRLPIKSIEYVLQVGGITLEDVDRINIGWDYEYLYKLLNKKFITKQEMSLALFHTTKFAEKIEYVSHHLAHAYSAFVPSNFKEALVLIIDGQGESIATSLYKAKRKGYFMEPLMESTSSLGYFYSAATKHIGLKVGEEGKAMGLVAYGKPTYYELLKDLIYFSEGKINCVFEIKKTSKDEENETIKTWGEKFSKIIKPREEKPIIEVKNEIYEYANFIASIQKVLEETLKSLITFYYGNTKIKNIAIAGGVGLNCPLNTALESLTFIKEVFVQPAANDGGISLGAAIKGAIDLEEDVNFSMIPYLGSSYSNDEIKDQLNKLSNKYYFCYKKQKNIEKKIAKLIFEENIVANFQGRLELGPRALGNRSLLASPSKKEMIAKINNLKGRERWRPLAPSVLFDHQKEWFNYEKFSPFMIKNCEVIKNKSCYLEAVTHFDGSARIQSVSREYNERFYNIINEFYKLSKIPVVVNTSFNIKGNPIVEDIETALKSIIEMNIDYMAIGDYLVKIDLKKYKNKKIGIVSGYEFLGIVPDDLMLKEKLKEMGFYPFILAWEDKKENYNKYNTIIIRSTWDYSKNLTKFIKWLIQLKRMKTNVINPINVVLKNISKYNQVKVLEDNNLSNNILTSFIKNKKGKKNIAKLVNREIKTKFKNTKAIVIKPFISANSYNTYLIEINEKLCRPNTICINDINFLYKDIIKEKCNGIILQEFNASIDNGESSIYCIDGKISHVTRKFTKVFDKSGKISRIYDKNEPLDSLSKKYYDLAKKIIDIPEYRGVVYMRIDLIEKLDKLSIMEVELTEPNFHFKDIIGEQKKDEAVTKMAKAIIKNMKK